MAKKAGKNLYWLNLSGGEPTDREDLTQIITEFIDHCPNLQILNFTTNGLNYENLETVLDFISKSNISTVAINISIDGPPQTHNLIRGTKDGFEMAIKAYKLILKYPKFKSSVAMTLFPNNFKLIGQTIEAIQEHVPNFSSKKLHLNFPHNSDHYYGNAAISYDQRIDLDYIKPFMKKGNSLFSLSQFVEKIYQKKLFTFLKTKSIPMSCAAIKSNIYISEKGDVYPCTIWDKKLGSLRDHEFQLDKIINSPLAVQTLEEIRLKKCPNCWTPCEAFPSIITNLKSI